MNLTRIVVLCVALVAAGAAVLLVRGMVGGGTPAAVASLPPPPQLTADVLVAAKDIPPGRALEVDAVRWESWPKSSVSDAFIVKGPETDVQKLVSGIVVRAPLVTGQPIGEASIVRAGSAGFMAATIQPGMRGMSLPISAETGAGGFILPNDRVDVVLTREVGEVGNRKIIATQTILRDVRVLAIDQSAQQPKDAQSAVGKTATVELTPRQVEMIASARAVGTISLALRPLGDSNDDTALSSNGFGPSTAEAGVNVIRYGVGRNGANSDEQRPVQ